MNPKPLKRSITFWSGIFVIAFLFLAWADSILYESDMRWNCFMAENNNSGFQVNSVYSFSGFSALRDAKVYGGSNRVSLAPIIAAPLFLRGSGDRSIPLDYDPSGTYRQNLERMMTRRAPEAWLVFIPHWLPLLAFALPWSGLLLWRARRHRRAAQAIAPAP